MLYITIKLIHTLNTLLLRLLTRNWKMKLEKRDIGKFYVSKTKIKLKKNEIGKFEPKFDINFKGIHFQMFLCAISNLTYRT